MHNKEPSLPPHLSTSSLLQNRLVPLAIEKVSTSSPNTPSAVAGEGEKKSSWNSLFSPRKPSMKLEFFEPKGKDTLGRICVAPPPEVAEQGATRWNSCAVGFFLGKRPPFFTVKRALERYWSSFGLKDVMTSGQGVFILKFQDIDGVMRAVEEGQLTIAGQPFLVRKWTTNLPMVINDVKKVAIWVRLYGIPLEFWTPKGLSYIASAIGNPLYVDSITEEGTRLDFARICIEVKVDAECPDSICLALPNGESVIIQVEYTWKPIKCKGCQCFGHTTASCSLAPKQNVVSIPRKTPKEGAGRVLPVNFNGKDKLEQVTKDFDNKTKGRKMEVQKLEGKTLLTHKNNRFSALTIKETQELGKENIILIEEGKHGISTGDSDAIMEGEKYTTSAANEKAQENDESSKSSTKNATGGDDSDQVASPMMLSFGGKLRMDEMDFKKEDADLKSRNLGKKAAKQRKENSTPIPSK
ncbi:uncharacterized protein LOC123219673 [Mangifera indica]|uniref:uncharacterized protein LOC123219673 n=1 Tax=Mangifera indica TaxID=29780 RepID=UPI001CFC0442|nr:uncharacterized protein LOC123219673 [Mangifera indica]